MTRLWPAPGHPAILRTSGVRLAALGAAVAAMGAVIVFVVIYYGTLGSLRQTLDASITNEIGEILPQGTATPAAEAAGAINAALAEKPFRIFYALSGPNGAALAGNLRLPLPAPGWHTLDTPAGGAFAQGVMELRVLVVRLRDGASLLVGVDGTMIRRLNDLIRRSFLIGFGLTLSLGLAAGIGFGRKALARVNAVSLASREIMAGDLSRRIPLAGSGDEFDRLAETVNAMLDRMQHLMENLAAVGNEIAHDLRSPLARLRETLELALRDPEPAATGTAIAEAIAQVDGALALCGAVLRLAQIETGARRASFSNIDLTDLLNRLVETYETVAEEAGHRLIAQVTPRLAIRGDAQLLNQMFANLIENAMTHAGGPARIGLVARAEATRVTVRLTDDGPGIAPDHRGAALRRFGRLDPARHRPGYGLGLPLSAAIAELHDAVFTLDDATQGANRPGLTVTLVFPASNAPRPG
ncbi:HAMP domain-containing sensor histidine kinase [Acidiphilium sp. C61]|jgi:signal transduction histidine kinase|uniref:sensor histidine kinase n=1 Tax=Acidiphilium sp. C61 TaxID=1671485 RepID=UPI00157B7A9C|nr:HAMP domain-containing sensor histidine kinase [Acidiphilium sp. C61]